MHILHDGLFFLVLAFWERKPLLQTCATILPIFHSTKALASFFWWHFIFLQNNTFHPACFWVCLCLLCQLWVHWLFRRIWHASALNISPKISCNAANKYNRTDTSAPYTHILCKGINNVWAWESYSNINWARFISLGMLKWNNLIPSHYTLIR